MNLISLPPCNGPFAFSQRKRGSKWVPPAHLLHYLEPGSQPQAWGGDRAPLSSGWREGGPESWATKVSKRECFEEALPFLRLRLSSCHPSGILLWWDRGVLASYLLCVLSSFLSPPPPLSVSSIAPCMSFTGATERGTVWCGANTNSSLLWSLCPPLETQSPQSVCAWEPPLRDPRSLALRCWSTP